VLKKESPEDLNSFLQSAVRLLLNLSSPSGAAANHYHKTEHGGISHKNSATGELIPKSNSFSLQNRILLQFCR
jgi:hypothetical protein